MGGAQLLIKSNVPDNPIYTSGFGSGHNPNTNNEMEISKWSFWAFLASLGKVPVVYAL